MDTQQTPKQYFYLGATFNARYDKTRQQEDLDNAITSYKGGLSICPTGAEDRVLLLGVLGFALLSKARDFGGLNFLEKAIIYSSEAIGLSQSGDFRKPWYLNNLGNALEARYQQLGNIGDMEKAISYHKEALDLSPSGQSIRVPCLNNLGNSLRIRYEKLGQMGDLERATHCHEEALDLCPPGQSGSGRSISLGNLGAALSIKYEQLGEMRDLEKAIWCYEQILGLYQAGHPHRTTSLNNLGMALKNRYQQLGKMEDLEKAINYHAQALYLCPSGNPDRLLYLNNLGLAFSTRFEHLREMGDLEKAIGFYKHALGLYTPGHPQRPMCLNNLGLALKSRYDQIGIIGDLEKAMSYHEKALNLSPLGHPHRPLYLNNLGNSVRDRYEKLGDVDDLEKAINYYKQALDLYPSGHPNIPTSLQNVGSTMANRYVQLGKVEDLGEAISYYNQALELYPSGHPDVSRSLNKLGATYYLQYVNSGNDESLQKAIEYHRQAAHSSSNLPQMFQGAKQWSLMIHKHTIISETPAYSLAMDLLHQHLALLPSLASQQKLVEKSSHLSLDAAAWAIENGTLDSAVQYLEQGRSILWSKIQGFRQHHKNLSEKAPHLAYEFQEISHKLEHNATSGSTDITLHHSQYKKWTTLLDQIRALDGFSDYLQATPFETLKGACAEGPVIMVNISDFRSDAIVLVLDSPPLSIPLQDVTPGRLEKVVDQLFKTTTTSDSTGTYQILCYLWNTIVQPVVTQLKQLNVPERSHVWWCPTSYLCALPLHAAGPYQKGSKNLPDLYISSYTPTLGSLIKARLNISMNKSALSLLLVSQPDDTIPQVFEEVKVINRAKVHVNSLAGYNADKQGILASLKSHPWVHFACHGHLEAQPLHSWFQLYNKEHLTVLDLAGAQLPNAEFAFLSACHSAAGNIHGTPDESIHLAGAMQVSGFPSVVGTLWAMVDDDGPPIADAFYSEIFADLKNVDVRDTAKALNIATKELRRKNVSVDRWINFIHLGA